MLPAEPAGNNLGACHQRDEQTNRSINTAQSAKTPDSHMIRPDHGSGLYRIENQPKEVGNARYPQCPGVTGAEAWYCWALLALAAFSWPPEGHTGSCSLSSTLCQEQRQHMQGLLVMSPKPKPGADPRLTRHKTAMGQQPVGKLTVTKGRSQVFPGDLNLQYLGPVCPLMGCPPPRLP